MFSFYKLIENLGEQMDVAGAMGSTSGLDTSAAGAINPPESADKKKILSLKKPEDEKPNTDIPLGEETKWDKVFKVSKPKPIKTTTPSWPQILKKGSNR